MERVVLQNADIDGNMKHLEKILRFLCGLLRRIYVESLYRAQ